MRCLRTLGLLFSALAFLAGCGGAAEDGVQYETVRVTVPAAPSLARTNEADAEAPPELSEAARAKIAQIKAILERNSLRGLAALGDSEPAFVSNYAGQSHRAHWDLLRRTGFDPLTKLAGLFKEPYGTRRVGEEIWYVWPDLAALDAGELIPERLSLKDRARLIEFVGEPGLARIRSGEGYGGVRTAISEDGDWVYYLDEGVPSQQTGQQTGQQRRPQ